MANPMYKTKAWRKLRIAAFERDGYRCQMCGVGVCGGRTHPRSAVGDHKEPHRNDPALFYALSNVQTLCKRCHDSLKQAQEKRGYSREVDPSTGWPIDNNHPANVKSRRWKPKR